MQSDSAHPQDNRQSDQPSNQVRSPGGRSALQQAQIESRRLARAHYENFLVASVLLPKRLRQPFYNVYAFCRTADDLADESPSPQVALERLNDFGRQLDETFAGRPRENLFIALADTVAAFDLPKQPFDDLLDAFRQDQHKTRYADFSELLGYCDRSANPVGRIVLRLGGCLDRENAELSDQICSGLQLANFWQDVARDHAIGRMYLPQQEMTRYGVSEAMLAEPSAPLALRELLASECDRAEGFFRRGLPLADRVPRWLARNVRLFAHGGLSTLEAIRKVDFDVLRRRPTVSKVRQVRLLAQAAMGLL